MKKNENRYSVKLFLFLLTYSLLAAQTLWADEKTDLKKLGEQLSKATSYDVSITLRMYKSSLDAKPTDTYKGELRRQDAFLYSDLMGETFVQNTDCAVYIDHSAKSMIYIKAEKKGSEKKENAKDFGDIQAIIDSVVGSRYEYKYIENSAKQKVISVIEKKSREYKKYYITLDPVTCLLKQVEYEYYDDSKGKNKGFVERVVISYDKFELNKKFDSSFFSESKYIKVTKNKLTVAPAYTAYKLVDQSK